MRDVNDLYFFSLGAIGPRLFPRKGSLADLVLALPYVVTHEIPPRQVLDDVLRRGRRDAGMSGGCIWKPLELAEADLADLVRELQQRGVRLVHGREPPALQELDLRTTDPVPTYEHWLEQLPVGDLYLGYLDAVDPAWETLPDGAFALPAEVVASLRPLAQSNRDWATHTRESLAAHGERGERARADVRECVDRLGLPRWPFDRFELELAGGA